MKLRSKLSSHRVVKRSAALSMFPLRQVQGGANELMCLKGGDGRGAAW